MERMLTQDCVDQLNLKDGISGYHTPLESLMVGEVSKVCGSPWTMMRVRLLFVAFRKIAVELIF